MKFQAVIFDLDGTIIDTSDIFEKVMQGVLAKRNIHMSKQEMQQLKSRLSNVGLDVACSIIKKEINITDPVEALVEEINYEACKIYEADVAFVKGFEDFHKKVCTYNLKRGIASNANGEALRHAKRHLNLESLFGEHIYGAQAVNYKYKPDPAIYLYMAQKLNVAPQNCIAIEDSPMGIDAAQSAGMFCIGINTAGMRESLKNADVIVESYDQIDIEKLLG